jgi:hypothetical protein
MLAGLALNDLMVGTEPGAGCELVGLGVLPGPERLDDPPQLTRKATANSKSGSVREAAALVDTWVRLASPAEQRCARLMPDPPIALAPMLFSGKSQRQRLIPESLNVSRNSREFPVNRRHSQTESLGKAH